MNDTNTALSIVAESLRSGFIGRSFGAIRFWRFAVVRPHDQAFRLTEVTVTGDRLDLSFIHDSGQGLPGVISLWAPQGVSVGDKGVTVRELARVRMDDNEAWSDGGAKYRIRTPRGEGDFDINGADALTLEV